MGWEEENSIFFIYCCVGFLGGRGGGGQCHISFSSIYNVMAYVQ